MMNNGRKNELKTHIKRLLKKKNALLVAHYYTDGDLQELAEETGGCVADSLEMARFGSRQDAETLVVCGVRFMAETAKILNPPRRGNLQSHAETRHHIFAACVRPRP